jgi:hypothetical protein
MPTEVLVAIITVVVGGSLTGGVSIILKRIDLKANQANSAVTNSATEVASMVETVKGMEILLNNQRIESDRKTARIAELEAELEDLEIQYNKEKEAWRRR